VVSAGSASFILTFILILAGLTALVIVLIFGWSVFETLLSLIRVAFEALADGVVVVWNGILHLGWYFFVLVLLIAGIAAWLVSVYLFKPGSTDLTKFRPPICTELLDQQGRALDYLCAFDGVRVWRDGSAISDNLKQLIVMLEDDKFYEHGGLDVDEIWNSIEKDLEKAKVVRGGSTITQQLAKNLFLTKEKSILRKVSEVPLAIRLERELTKDQILELYLNTIEWGPGVFGVEAASRLYFDHSASSLSESEAWLLALMIPNPKELNLWMNPRAERSLVKRGKHLSTRLYLEHRLSRDEAGVAYQKFLAFLKDWSAKRPSTMWAGRKYPARWQESGLFSLSEVVSIRRGAAGFLRRYRVAPIKLHLDRELQQKLEATVDAKRHVTDFSNVIALMDGEHARAIAAEPSSETRSQIMQSVTELASKNGLIAKVLAARNIPATALFSSQ
jgi:monofunctional biosynthetic peptidoglycan transglycosylase